MGGASAAAYFRQWPLPSTSLEQLTAIANDRAGWTAQAILFPVCFLAVALIFGWMAARLPGPWPRWLAVAAALLSASALLLWLPISANRLHLGAQAAELLRAYDPSAPLPVLIDVNTFWPYTFAALAGVLPTLAGPWLGWPWLGWPWPRWRLGRCPCTTGRPS